MLQNESITVMEEKIKERIKQLESAKELDAFVILFHMIKKLP